MKKINIKNLFVTSVVCLLPIIIGLFFYNKLPENIAIHFDINNNPDNYFPKPVFVFGMPILTFILQVFCLVCNDLSNKNLDSNKKAISVYKWIIPVITVVMYIVTIMYSLGNKLDIRKIVMILIGIEFIILGNYSPKTKGMLNGLKSLNENDYKHIARILGYMFIINGLLCFASTLFNQYVSIAVILIVILEMIILFVYSILKNTKRLE